MVDVTPLPGLEADYPWADTAPRWVQGFNVRFRPVGDRALLETVGLHGALRDISGASITLPINGTEYVRSIKAVQKATEGIQYLCGAANKLWVVSADPTAIPGGGIRYRVDDVSVAGGFPPTSETLPDPPLGESCIPPVWHWADDGTTAVGLRADIDDRPYIYSRNRQPVTQLANAPKFAVGCSIMSRQLILLGCEPSGGITGTERWNCIRASDQYNYDSWTIGTANLVWEEFVANGSRLLAGGHAGSYGTVCWTDQSMHTITRGYDILAPFRLDDVDGARGIMANRAWTHADGRVWFLDSHRELCVYDGGRPRRIPNPLKAATLELLDACSAQWTYMSDQAEFGEILIWYALGTDVTPTRCVVYNYALNVWYVWAFARPTWTPRLGVNLPIASDTSGRVLNHDLDVSLPGPYLPVGTPAVIPAANLLDGFSWQIRSNPVMIDEPARQTQDVKRFLLIGMHTPAPGAENDSYNVVLTGYEDPEVTSRSTPDSRVWDQDRRMHDYRVSGRAVDIELNGQGSKTVFRWGRMDIWSDPGGER